jgi:threonine synthase
MQLISTNGGDRSIAYRDALFESMAADGGLYTPRELDPIPQSTLASFRGADFGAISTTLARNLLGGEFDNETLDEIVATALDFPIPLTALTNGIHLLELFHGPTLAFKDVGARFMARTMRACNRSHEQLTVLVATSGDTGSAVADAFLGLENTRIIVLFPDGQVSDLQERQFTTLGENVRALAVQGTFDDCQKLAKTAFADGDLRRRVPLTSANSINIGRLLPQIFYYFGAWAQLPPSDRDLVFCTPSGNFGNLTAGLMAKRLGLPVGGFVAATNINDVVPTYLASGTYRPRPSERTISNAMDVGDPSNLTRIIHLYDGDLDHLRGDVSAFSATDDETRRCIREVYDTTGRILDPHTAVGRLGLARELSGRRTPIDAILIATAHPAKFREVVEPVIGAEIELPERLAVHLKKERRVTPIGPVYEELRSVLLEN